MEETELSRIYNLTHNGRNNRLSCGFLIVDRQTGKFLACHSTGKPKDMFDITKGHLDPPENPLECAIRECREETGLSVNPNEVFDCGQFTYQKDKDLHIFIYVTDINIPELHCDSTFEMYGKQLPEMNGYSLVNDFSLFYKNLGTVLEEAYNRPGAKEFIEARLI